APFPTGQKAILQVTPVLAPPGWSGSSIDEGTARGGRAGGGSAAVAAKTGMIPGRGIGKGVWGDADEFYFLHRPVSGDFRVTVRALGRPTETEAYAQAGLMLRESLDFGARLMMLDIVSSDENGLLLKRRQASNVTIELDRIIQEYELR